MSLIKNLRENVRNMMNRRKRTSSKQMNPIDRAVARVQTGVARAREAIQRNTNLSISKTQHKKELSDRLSWGDNRMSPKEEARNKIRIV